MSIQNIMHSIKFLFLFSILLAYPELNVFANIINQARSPYHAPAVRLWWKHAEKTTHYYSSIIVKKSAMNSYFCTNGFHGGYFGIQQRKDYKVVIFSLWDQHSEAELVYSGHGVIVSHFDREGTGVKTFLKYKWNELTPYHFLIESTSSNEKTIFTAWFYRYDINSWFKMASIQNKLPNPYLTGLYSFIEVYRGSGAERVSVNGPTWMKSAAGWSQSYHAVVSFSNTKAKNIRVFKNGSNIEMKTGGPDIPNPTPHIGSLSLQHGKFPCVLTTLPGIKIADKKLITHCN